MTVSRSLSGFQQQCESKLSSALASKGLALGDRIVAGESESYVRASVLGTDLEVYIYEDEAQLHRGGRRAAVFEHQDFADATELQEAFVSAVVQATNDI
jgi:hypothetical protein